MLLYARTTNLKPLHCRDQIMRDIISDILKLALQVKRQRKKESPGSLTYNSTLEKFC